MLPRMGNGSFRALAFETQRIETNVYIIFSNSLLLFASCSLSNRTMSGENEEESWPGTAFAVTAQDLSPKRLT